MINPYHANVIDMLREAAKEHGAVADLLECLSEGFTFFTSGDTSFNGSEQQRAYTNTRIRSGQEFKYFCGICWNKIREAE